MRILVIGSGGREHALAWKIKQSPKVDKIFCAPGNAGISSVAECVPIKAEDFDALADFVNKEKIDLTVVGPEIPLAMGIVDFFNEKGLKIFGPNKKASKLEGSKVFSKNFMKKYSVPTASYDVFSDYSKAQEFVDGLGNKKVVVKADGLAAGKGVLICNNKEEAKKAVDTIIKENKFGSAGKEVVIEEYLDGEEVSLQIFVDGKNYKSMIAAQDHKRIFDNDEGPNTGGMGAYAPAPIVNDNLLEKIKKKVINPVIQGLNEEKIDYKGILYVGLMIIKDEPYILEFNCRFGDPETQVIVPLLKTDLIEIIENINNSSLDKIQIEWYNNKAVCVVASSKGYPGSYTKGKEISGLDETEKMKDLVVFHSGTLFKNEQDTDSGFINSGGRVLGVTGLGSDIPQAIKKAYEGIEKIKFEGMHYRKDIGRRALA